MTLDQSLVERIDAYLKKVGVHPIEDVHEASKETPLSLIIPQKIAFFEDSEPSIGYSISWCPPIMNWNPWRSSNIDERPLATVNFS